MPKEPKAAGTTPDTGAPGKPAAATKRKKEFKKKRERRVVPHGYVHIAASFNNTQITITDTDGRVMCWSSAGAIGFKGSRKGTPYAAQQASLAGGRGRRARPVRDEERGSEGEGSGFRPRVRGTRAGRRRIAHRGDSRCHADSAQRLPSAKAEAGLKLRTAKNGWATTKCWATKISLRV